MSLPNIALEGKYYDGEQPVSHPASLVFSGGEATLTSGDMSRTYDTLDMLVSPRTGRADRLIALPDGGQFHCEDQPFLDKLPQEIRSEGPVAWLEERLSVALVGIAVIVASVLLGYFYGLPAIAESVITRIPIETEKEIGIHALDWLDENNWLHASNMDLEQQDTILEIFNNLHKDLSMSKYINLEFRRSDFLGPNAFAFPGGIIVIMDEMINTAESEEEVLAVLAHEIGHVEMRHSLRQVLQTSAVALVATTITADAASLSVAVAGLPAILAQTKYSRDFEIEADDFAYELLKRNDISPEAFASLMERLDQGSESMKSFSFCQHTL